MQLKTIALGLFLLLNRTYTEAKALSLITTALQVKISDYVGNWIGYTADGSEFKLVLREQKGFKFVTGQFRDVILGNHSYITKGKELINESFSKPKDGFILIGIPDSDNPNEIEVSFSNRVHHKTVNVALILIISNAKSGYKSLHWLLKSETETITINAKEKTLRGISVPTDIILKKVD